MDWKIGERIFWTNAGGEIIRGILREVPVSDDPEEPLLVEKETGGTLYEQRRFIQQDTSKGENK